MTCGFLILLVFCQKKKNKGFIGVEVEQETSAPPPKKNPGSAPVKVLKTRLDGGPIHKKSFWIQNVSVWTKPESYND